MSEYENTEVPFVPIDGKNALTAEQVENSPELKAFIGRYANSFYFDHARQAYIERVRFNSPGYGRAWGRS